MDVTPYLNKIKLLIQNLYEGQIVFDENNAEKLLKFLEDRTQNSIGKLESPSFSDHMFNLLAKVTDSRKDSSHSAKAFLISIVTILFKNELQFSKMQLQGFEKFSSRICLLAKPNCVPSPDIHLACIKLATVHVTHCSGISNIKESKVWKTILYPYIHLRPKQIADAAYNFMAKLVWKLNEYNNEQELIEVLGYIVEPILSSGYLNIPVIDTETDKELADKIYTNISALSAILAEGSKLPPSNRVMPSLLKDYFIIEHRLFEIFAATKNMALLRLLSTCLFRYSFESLKHLLYEKQVDEFCNKMTIFHRNYIVQGIKKREAIIIVDFVVQSNIIWSHFKKSHETVFNFPLTFERNGQQYELSLQLLVHLLMPMLKFGSLHMITGALITDVVEHYIVKMGRTVVDYIFTSCYLFCDYLEEGGETFRKQVTIHALKELLRLKGHISETQAGPMFQALYYLLEIFILCDETGRLVEPVNLMDADSLRLLSYLLDGMKMLLKEHNIPWYENLEIVNIQADLLNLLKQSFLTSKQVGQVLDLIDICVKKFLSPNMSLLVDSNLTQDGTLSEISKVIKLYSQHNDWEVRDSALNLLNTCTEIAFIKYVPLQKMIKDNNLIILAAKIALTDPEFYSQCTALKCLTAATKIDHIWQEVLVDNTDIYIQLIYIARNHDEGMVRKEVINVLTGIYFHQKLDPAFHNTMYEIMTTAAIDDLHWEVQLAALQFWRRAILKHLTYRGMLDGKFPPVTFSREKRKIIVLDDLEIHRQLTGIMSHLSNIGCLTVLKECMNSLNNIEVMELAYSIGNDLLKMLDKYKFHGVTENVKTELADVAPKHVAQADVIPMDLTVSNEEERNKVIDSILSIDQSELIINLHDKHNQTKSEEMDIDIAYIPRRQLVSANEFLETFRNNDYNLLIEEKKNYGLCVVTFDGLVDEMLGL